MKKFAAKLVLFAAVSLLPTAVAGATNPIFIEQDTSQILKLPDVPSGIIISNPAVADALVHDGRTLVVSGRAFGQTNIITLDEAGEIMSEYKVIIQAQTENRLTLQRGRRRSTYSCTPDCNIIPQLGDATYTVVAEQEAAAMARGAGAAGANSSAPVTVSAGTPGVR